MSIFHSPGFRRVAAAIIAGFLLIALFSSSSESRRTVGRYSKDLKNVILKHGAAYLPFTQNQKSTLLNDYYDDYLSESDDDEKSPNNNDRFEHQPSFHLIKDERTKRQCDPIPIDNFWSIIAQADRLNPDQPFVYHFNDGHVVDEATNEFHTTAEFCTVFFVPQKNKTKHQPAFQNRPIKGMGPDSIHAEIASNDVRLILPKFHYWGLLRTSAENHTLAQGDVSTEIDIAIYHAAYQLNHPGDYEIIGETEFRAYDWVMEDPIDLNAEPMPHMMFNRPLRSFSPALHIIGVPESRPRKACYQGPGPHDLSGRWYRAASFGTTGNMTMNNVAARVMFADHNTTVDEWGWTFAPDACDLTFFEPADHINCFAGKTMQILGDSNSRRLLKSLIGGEVAWCTDREDQICNCVDHVQTELQDASWQNLSAAHLRDVTLRGETLDFNIAPKQGHVYFDFIGGVIRAQMMNAWAFFFDKGLDGMSTMDHREKDHGPIDLLHVSTLGWDIGGVRTPNEMLHALRTFKNRTFEFYAQENSAVQGDRTRMVHRLANGNCCGNQHPHARYSPPRFVMFNQAWRTFWAEEERKGVIRVVDASVLQGRRDAETKFGCKTTHFPADHVRIEAMMWLNAVCEKVVGGGAKMRDDWGLPVDKSFANS